MYYAVGFEDGVMEGLDILLSSPLLLSLILRLPDTAITPISQDQINK